MDPVFHRRTLCAAKLAVRGKEEGGNPYEQMLSIPHRHKGLKRTHQYRHREAASARISQHSSEKRDSRRHSAMYIHIELFSAENNSASKLNKPGPFKHAHGATHKNAIKRVLNVTMEKTHSYLDNPYEISTRYQTPSTDPGYLHPLNANLRKHRDPNRCHRQSSPRLARRPRLHHR